MTRIPIDDDQPGELEPESPQPGPQDRPADTADTNEILKLRSERDQLFERLARATAEYKNSQKRVEAEFDSRIQYANSSLIKAILPTIDNFERALAQDATKVDAASILKGMEIIHNQLMAVLKAQKVEEIAPKIGDLFEPGKHEAVIAEPSDAYTEPSVTKLFEKGYQMYGRVIRTAKVAVSKIA
jgi:molecular chaperone GrpE